MRIFSYFKRKIFLSNNSWRLFLNLNILYKKSKEIENFTCLVSISFFLNISLKKICFKKYDKSNFSMSLCLNFVYKGDITF